MHHRIQLKALLLVYKSLYRLGPEYLTDLLHKYCPPRPLRSQEQNLLLKPTTRSKRGEVASGNHAVCLWNQLPGYIKNAQTVQSFKAKLKTEQQPLANACFMFYALLTLSIYICVHIWFCTFALYAFTSNVFYVTTVCTSFNFVKHIELLFCV